MNDNSSSLDSAIASLLHEDGVSIPPIAAIEVVTDALEYEMEYPGASDLLSKNIRRVSQVLLEMVASSHLTDETVEACLRALAFASEIIGKHDLPWHTLLDGEQEYLGVQLEYVIELLGNTGDSRYTEILEAYCVNEDKNIRSAAVGALFVLKNGGCG